MIEDIYCIIKDIDNRNTGTNQNLTEVMEELSTFMVGSLLTSLGASYMVKYFDCVNPVAITTY